MLGIGIIGAGAFGENHAKAIAETGRAKLVAASRRDKGLLDKFSRKFNVRGYTDYRELLKNDDIKAVVIAAPHQDHTQIAVDTARSGKHILLEKPMAASLEDCDEIIRSAKAAGITLMIGHTMQFIPSSIVAREVIDSGELGKIIYSTGIVEKKWVNPNRRNWHMDDPVGGGMLLTVGIHYIDLLTWLNRSRVSSVRANISTHYHKQEADDTAMAYLQFESGTTGMIISTGYDTGANTFLATLTCEKGILRIDMTGGVHLGQKEKWNLLPGSKSETAEQEALVNEWNAFINAVESESIPQVTGEYGKHIMEICFAARESSLKNKEIWI